MSEGPSADAYRLVQGFRVYQMLAAACELKLPDLLATGPKTVHELAAVTGTHEQSMRRFVRGLAMWGVARELAGDRFEGTPLTDSFRSDRPGLRNMTINLQSEGYGVWGELLYTLRTGEPAYEHLYGKPRWADLADDPQAAARFNAHMVEATTRIAADFVAHYDLAGIATAVDVGGGNGALLAAVLKANPRMSGVLFDLPAGLAGARQFLEDAGVADRARLVDGSFFEAVPPGGDLYMLKSIVHDWDDEHALEILKTCRRAMQPSARLVLLERVLPDRFDGSDGGLEAVMTDLHMMVSLGGRERSTDEYRDLLAAAGLNLTSTKSAGSGYRIFEAVPA